MSYVFEKYSAGGSGGTGSGIIEVDELPTENIDENAVYRVNGYSDVGVWYSLHDWGIVNPAPFDELVHDFNPASQINYMVADTYPENPQPTDLTYFMTINIYIIDNIPYVYGNAGSGNMWIAVSMVIAPLLQQEGHEALADKGYLSNPLNMSEHGLYVTYLKNPTAESVETDLVNVFGKWDRKDNLLSADYLCRVEEVKAEQLGGVSYIRDCMFAHRVSEYIPDQNTSRHTTLPNFHLSKITIPTNIKNIGEHAFYECRRLTTIVYQGTKAMWKAIRKGGFWDNFTGDYTIYCTDGTIAKDGTET